MQKKNINRKSGYSGMKYLFFIALTFLMYSSCDEIDSEIPDVPVRIELNLNSPLYNDLTFPGNTMLLKNAGFGGIIVTCLTEGEHFAYDAACTHEILPSCQVEPTGLIGTCSCCSSEFQLFYSATPVKGPAAAPLKQYNISLVGNTLKIYN
ncbi:Rieske (2Fe-2S) protein [Draconibacterium sediminis]|uniref:Rieske domain-containing protein n=1 Tax=Draconibacterium sediminis TaxID=1544798 RepID=A0A0D8J876_9BACT|nr:hypothetical protein [Draconibacterium sediminis]KJF43082.1 hypothetical protein LH29_17025 [Draconibacterium sediminis]